jgi:SAM-dependent methyltransferase
MPADSGGAALPTFEEIYAAAGDDLASVPWARLSPHPLLLMWLDGSGAGSAEGAPRPPPAGRPALVIACGLGDDAEELARRGYAVTAFDSSPTAIAQCRRRFPGSAVDYRVADLFAVPGDWNRAFDLVVEINTIQSLPRPARPAGVAAIAATVAPGGLLFVRCMTGDEGEPDDDRPWPVRRSELGGFTAAGLTQADLIDQAPVAAARPWLRLIYQRPAAQPEPPRNPPMAPNPPPDPGGRLRR